MIKELFEYLLASFDTHNKGASGRKLTAFALVVCIGYLHVKYASGENAFSFLCADLVTVLLLFGVITGEQLIKLKNGSNDVK